MTIEGAREKVQKRSSNIREGGKWGGGKTLDGEENYDGRGATERLNKGKRETRKLYSLKNGTGGQGTTTPAAG